MGVKVLALNKRCHVAFPAAPRRACTVYGAKRTSAIVAFGDLVLIPGTLTVHCEAVNRGAMYDIGDGEFTWRSKDQVCKAVNVGAFTGGGLVDNGGIGTVITPVMIDEESPTNLYIRDEEI